MSALSGGHWTSLAASINGTSLAALPGLSRGTTHQDAFTEHRKLVGP
jgi:hypothetical protein